MFASKVTVSAAAAAAAAAVMKPHSERGLINVVVVYHIQ
jgi:hypothetical protein